MSVSGFFKHPFFLIVMTAVVTTGTNKIINTYSTGQKFIKQQEIEAIMTNYNEKQKIFPPPYIKLYNNYFDQHGKLWSKLTINEKEKKFISYINNNISNTVTKSKDTQYSKKTEYNVPEFLKSFENEEDFKKFIINILSDDTYRDQHRPVLGDKE